MTKDKFKIVVQTELNRLYLYINGFVTDGEVRSIIKKINDVIFDLTEGFAFIIDISNNALASKNIDKDFQKALAMLKGYGVGVIIRVIGNNTLGNNFLKLRHGSGNSNVKVFQDHSQAERFLIQFQSKLFEEKLSSKVRVD